MDSISPFTGGAAEKGFAAGFRFLPLGLLLLGLGSSLLYWRHEVGVEEEFARLRFTKLADKVQEVAEKRLTSYEALLRGIQGLFLTSDQVGVGQWRRFLDALEPGERLPGVVELFFAYPVSGTGVASFESLISERLGQEYRVRVEEFRETHIPVVFSYPIDPLRSFYVPGNGPRLASGVTTRHGRCGSGLSGHNKGPPSQPALARPRARAGLRGTRAVFTL
ncbi:MAG: CHASE domain-containing protein, partial [Magnetococcales bacterium]|nr:CHASE domain-containing protein [Magnetococcales bacterium]